MKISKIIGGALLVCVIGKGAASVSSVPAECEGSPCCSPSLLTNQTCNSTYPIPTKTCPDIGELCCDSTGSTIHQQECTWFSKEFPSNNQDDNNVILRPN